MAINKKKILKRAKNALRFLPDKSFIQLYYFVRFHHKCDFINPRTYNEKLQWLKLNNRDPLYTKLVDKFEVKEWVASRIGAEYVVPTIGVWDTFDDIDFNDLPNRFVLKCTHDSEGLVIVQDKSTFDVCEAQKIIESAMAYNFYYIGREWPYYNVRPRIIAEPYLEDKKFGELRDYKFFCFGGEPKCMFVATGRSAGNTKFDYYDLEFRHLDIKQHYLNSDVPIEKPDTYSKMIELSKILSKNMPHVRIDFYEVDGRLYFGECTFYHFSGFMPFEPTTWDVTFGNWLNLPNKQIGKK